MEILNVNRRIFFSGILLLFFVINGYGQNKVPNPSFEVFEYCPVGPGSVGILPCRPWRSAANGTPDYFNACAIFPGVIVPNNGFGWQQARTGVAYTGGFLFAEVPDSLSYREYLLAPLQGAPLIKGHTYQVSFYVSSANTYSCGIATIGAYFSAPRPSANTNTAYHVKPQVESDIGFITDTMNWVLISGCFIAEGGEQWMTIGNFHDNKNTALDPNCLYDVAYYFFDDVSVIETGLPAALPIDLPDSISSCGPYTIAPGLSGVDYLWEDGSTDTTLTVLQSDTYSVTISDGCSQGIDSIAIEMFEITNLDIGPSALSLCEGEVYTVSLDSTLGIYTWQDGSHSLEYTISTPGIYQVSLDGPCGISNDETIVDFINPPVTFDLGSTLRLCDGDTLWLTPGIDNVEYLWQDGSTTTSLEITSPGDISLVISNVCGTTFDSVTVIGASPPTPVDIGEDTVLCPGESIILSIADDSYEIEWQDGSHGTEMLADRDQVYAVQVSNDCGSTSDSLHIRIDSLWPQLNWKEVIQWCPGDTVQLIATQPFDATYEWSNGMNTSSIEISQPGMYSVDITTFCGHLNQQINVIHDPSCYHDERIYIPNVFSPNADQVNDFFSISLSAESEVSALQVSIYDRWGNQVFSADTYPFTWDGNFKGKNVSAGVYAYTIRIQFSSFGEVSERKLYGDITLLR